MTPEPTKAEEAMGTMVLAAISLLSVFCFAVGFCIAWLIL